MTRHRQRRRRRHQQENKSAVRLSLSSHATLILQHRQDHSFEKCREQKHLKNNHNNKTNTKKEEKKMNKNKQTKKD
jgi:hypothetical protein